MGDIFAMEVMEKFPLKYYFKESQKERAIKNSLGT